MSRNVIIHCHLFKNAGSTFDWSLEKNFKKAFVDHRDDDSMQKDGYLEEYLEEHNQLQALSSHHPPMPLTQVEGLNYLPVFFIRNTIDRVGSVYEFEKKQRAETPGAIHAKKLSFNDYVAWRMRLDFGATIREFQVRFSSGTMKKRIITEENLAQSKEQLASSRLTGLVELYDESMVIFEEDLKQNFEKIDLSYIRQNKGKRSKFSREDRISSVLDELEEDTKAQLLENNKLDIELHHFTEELVRKRMDEIENFDQKLANFKDRCEKLQVSHLS